jgi:4,5-dihydroxyphthalate decarboxylase
MTDTQTVALHALLGDYPLTLPLKKGEVRSPQIKLDFADVKVPHTAFKRTVRNLEFEVSELAIVTFLMAKAHGAPLVLVPAVVTARFQHPYIGYNPARGTLGPGDLAGKRVGVRSYSVTTVAWLRGILMQDYGLDIDRVHWVTFEDSHIAQFRDPPTAERAPAGKDLKSMLLAGEVDAAIFGEPVTDPQLKPLFPDPAAAAQDWYKRNGVVQINHMLVVKEALSKSNPDAVREVYRLLAASKQAAQLPAPGALDINPLGIEAVRPGLEIIIDYVYRQRLIPKRYAVDELFDDVTRALGR